MHDFELEKWDMFCSGFITAMEPWGTPEKQEQLKDYLAYLRKSIAEGRLTCDEIIRNLKREISNKIKEIER